MDGWMMYGGREERTYGRIDVAYNIFVERSGWNKYASFKDCNVQSFYHKLNCVTAPKKLKIRVS